MKGMVQSAVVVCFILLVAYAEVTLAFSIGLSHRNPRERADQLSDDYSKDTDLSTLLQKRTCNGFPCMYSHLGTKAGRASLYKTLAGFIDDCFSDPSCDPGRRKRHGSMRSVEDILNTPVGELHKRSLQEQYSKQTY